MCDATARFGNTALHILSIAARSSPQQTPEPQDECKRWCNEPWLNNGHDDRTSHEEGMHEVWITNLLRFNLHCGYSSFFNIFSLNSILK